MGVSHMISIVGAGPGDPELLTVKAQNRIKNADVILYDALIGTDILELAKPGAELIYAGKKCRDGQHQGERQEEIHRCFLEFARQNKIVARVKGGDPMIFGRGAEEIRFCRENNLNFEVIPGITAGIAAASTFQIPLTERGKNRMVLLYTGHLHNGRFDEINAVTEVLKTGSPVVLYMGLHHLGELSKALLESAINPETHVNIASCISHPNQNAFNIPLNGIESFLKNNRPETPCVVMIGKNAVKI